MFSNGTEYESFLSANCESCKKFVYFDDATEDNPTCPIEESISLGVEEIFPYDKLIKNGIIARYTCKEFIKRR